MIPIDKFGRKIYSKAFKQIEAIGKQLLLYGYTESRSKPNLFFCRYNIVVFYADLRGTEVIPIWEDPSAVMYWNWRSDKLSLKERQLAVLIELTRLQGVPWRLLFYTQYDSEEAELVLSMAEQNSISLGKEL